jgi:hypothetical protein
VKADPEDGGNNSLPNGGKLLPDFMASYLRRFYF